MNPSIAQRIGRSVPEGLDNVFGSKAKSNPVGRVVDAARRADYAIDSAQENLATTMKKAMENREKLTGLAGFFFGAKLDPRLETLFKIVEESPKYASYVVAAAFWPIYLTAAASGFAAGVLEGHFKRRQDEYKKEFEALAYDAEGIMNDVNHFPENRFAREVMVDILPGFLFDLGLPDYKESKVSRTEVYNAGEFTKRPNDFDPGSKEQDAYVKIRVYSVKKVITSLGGSVGAITDAEITDALQRCFVNMKAGVPVGVGNPNLGAIMSIVCPSRALNPNDLIGLYYNSAARNAESMVKSSIQEKIPITSEADEVKEKIADEKAGELTRLTGIPSTPAVSRDAIMQMYDLLNEGDPTLAFLRYIRSAGASPLIVSIYNKFNQNAAKLKEYFFERPTSFIDLKIRELNRLAGNPSLDLGNPAVLRDQRDALMWLLSSDSQATLNVLVNPTPPAVLSRIGLIAKELIEKAIGLHSPGGATPPIAYDTHFMNFINIVEGKDSSHYAQAKSLLSISLGLSEVEIVDMLGSSTELMKDKVKKDDTSVLAYFLFKALVGPCIDLRTHSLNIPLNISMVPKRTAGARTGLPPYSFPFTSNRDILDRLKKVLGEVTAYESKKDPQKRTYLIGLDDFDLALFCLLNSNDPLVKSLTGTSPPAGTVGVAAKNLATYSTLNPAYTGITKHEDLDADTILKTDLRKKMGSANLLDTYKVDPYSLLGLPAFIQGKELKSPATKLLNSVEAADQVFNLENSSVKPGANRLVAMIEGMFEGKEKAAAGAVSKQFFSWLYSLRPNQLLALESGSYHEQWVLPEFRKYVRRLMSSLKSSGIPLSELVSGTLMFNGVRVEAIHLDVIAIYILNQGTFYDKFQKYKLQARSVQAYIDDQALLQVHNKGLASYMRADLESKGVHEGDVENISRFGSHTALYILDIPKPLEDTGEYSKIANYVEFVGAKNKKLEAAFKKDVAQPFGSTVAAAMTHLSRDLVTHGATLEDDLNTLVSTSPEASANLLYLYELYPTAARSFADFVTFMTNPANDQRILRLIAENTDDVRFNRMVLRNLRNNLSSLVTLYNSGTFFRSAIDNPNVSAFELFSLMLATFNTKGRDSNLEVPNFREITTNLGSTAARIASLPQAQRFLQDIYVSRMSDGAQLSHPTQSPLVIISKAVERFGEKDLPNALAERYKRLEAERIRNNPAPDPEGNQFVNAARALVGDKGNLALQDDTPADW